MSVLTPTQTPEPFVESKSRASFDFLVSSTVKPVVVAAMTPDSEALFDSKGEDDFFSADPAGKKEVQQPPPSGPATLSEQSDPRAASSHFGET
jgi:hypothetical protein